jgi:hypothetical protein
MWRPRWLQWQPAGPSFWGVGGPSGRRRAPRPRACICAVPPQPARHRPRTASTRAPSPAHRLNPRAIARAPPQPARHRPRTASTRAPSPAHRLNPRAIAIPMSVPPGWEYSFDRVGRFVDGLRVQRCISDGLAHGVVDFGRVSCSGRRLGRATDRRASILLLKSGRNGVCRRLAGQSALFVHLCARTPPPRRRPRRRPRSRPAVAPPPPPRPAATQPHVSPGP